MIPGRKNRSQTIRGRENKKESKAGPDSALPVEFLHIGECMVTDRDMLVNTVLGSCVSATFFHEPSGLCGIFHAMMPERDLTRQDAMTCKYVDSSIELIHTAFQRKGISPARVVVKLFGGGFTIRPDRKNELRDIVDVGRKNVLTARRVLGELGYTITLEHVMGNKGRKILFDTRSGDVWLKMLPGSQNRPLA